MAHLSLLSRPWAVGRTAAMLVFAAGVRGTPPARPPASAQVQGPIAGEPPAQRLASIVGVAVGEYAKGVDAKGVLISADERDEATGFLTDAHDVAVRLPGDARGRAVVEVDSLLAAMRAQRPLGEVQGIYRRFSEALGAAGVLEVPHGALDLANGRTLYKENCLSCHGATGAGDGPASHGLSTQPVAIGTKAMDDVSPVLMYRMIAVGVRGTAMPAWTTALTAAQRWNIVAYVTALRSSEPQVRQGEGLYIQRCASCHGSAGAGSGIYAHDLTTIPPEIGTFAWQAQHSDSDIARAIVQGVPGTAMPATHDLSATDITSLVAYLRSVSIRHDETPMVAGAALGVASDTSSGARAAQNIMGLLNAALVAARGGRENDARDRAFDSYIAFEPLEPAAQAKDPGLVSAMERHFADFKGFVQLSDLRSAERARDAIEVGLPDIVRLTKPTAGGWSAFFQSLLIILREGFEAILVVGAVVAFLIKTGHKDRLRSIWMGAILGILASAVTAVVLATLLRALPASREILEGATLLVAVVVLFSVSYWLVSKVEAAHWQQFIRDKVSNALEHGGGQALAFVAFLAVYREGAETALFYQALFNEGSHLALPLTLGIAVGGVMLAVIFTLFYRFGVRIPLRPFFTVTGALLYYMAFVFAGKGVRELQEGGAVPITLLSGFPHVEAMGIFPSVETLLAQLVLLALLAFALIKTFWPKRSVALPTVAVSSRETPTSSRRVRLEGVSDRLTTVEASLADLQRRIAEMEIGEMEIGEQEPD